MKRFHPLLLAALAILSCGKPSPERFAARPVLFVGLDGADWELLDLYFRKGTMPNLAALAEEGRTGYLTTLQPPLSPLVWTTMMTGVSPPIQAFERALAITSDHPAALWNLSDLLFPIDRDRSDQPLLRALAAGLHDGARRVLARAVAYSREDQVDRRLKLLDQALIDRPAEPKLRLARGQTRFERQECRLALADFEEAARLAPREAMAHNGVGLAHLCLGDPEQATVAFRRSLEIDPAQPEIRKALHSLW